MAEMEELREEWRELYSRTLPRLARERDPAQNHWPVSLDHCFARIILDNAIGHGEQQWDRVIAKPAVRSMNELQLRKAIELGNDILQGKVDLRDLDEISLRCRGKNESKYGKSTPSDETRVISRKRKYAESDDSSVVVKDECQDKAGDQNGYLEPQSPNTSKKQKSQGRKQSTLDFAASGTKSSDSRPKSTSRFKSSQILEKSAEQYDIILQRIQNHPGLTPYRRRLYTILLSVPTGRYTTYAAMSTYLDSSARAVGSGMRNNPFAPEVPCHRVLAADGSIGGFGGDWGKEGKHAKKKIDLLRSEGVKFDGKGKVVGEPFRKFHEFDSLRT